MNSSVTWQLLCFGCNLSCTKWFVTTFITTEFFTKEPFNNINLASRQTKFSEFLRCCKSGLTKTRSLCKLWLFIINEKGKSWICISKTLNVRKGNNRSHLNCQFKSWICISKTLNVRKGNNRSHLNCQFRASLAKLGLWFWKHYALLFMLQNTEGILFHPVWNPHIFVWRIWEISSRAKG